jgi:hypothetical protein
MTPFLTASDLLNSVPPLALAAEVRAETLSTKPSASLKIADLFEALDWAPQQAVTDGAVGVVAPVRCHLRRLARRPQGARILLWSLLVAGERIDRICAEFAAHTLAPLGTHRN